MKQICLLLACLMLSSFASCSKSSLNRTDEIYYNNSNNETSVFAAETVEYTIEENKVITDDYTLFGMNDLRIASDLFAHYVAKYASDAICSVNGAWGDGWSMNAIQSDTINIRNNDINAWKYEKIWYAAPEIKEYAWGLNVYLTL